VKEGGRGSANSSKVKSRAIPRYTKNGCRVQCGHLRTQKNTSTYAPKRHSSRAADRNRARAIQCMAILNPTVEGTRRGEARAHGVWVPCSCACLYVRRVLKPENHSKEDNALFRARSQEIRDKPASFKSTVMTQDSYRPVGAGAG